MNEVRNVYKNQILSEDIALGIGIVNQVRNGKHIVGKRLAIPTQVANIAEMQQLVPLVVNYVMVPITDSTFDVYLYRDDVTTGLPAVEPYEGTWVKQASLGNTVISEEPPQYPTEGLTWVRCTDMRNFVWYVDAEGGQWVEGSPSRGGTTTVSLPIFTNDGTAASGGLLAGALYRTSTGEVRVKL